MPVDPNLRPHIQNFYKALRENDVDVLEDLAQKGCPVQWVQTFAETSLPEYAMRHGSVESAWWLMAQGVMPEKWADFTGSAWKTFLKKGLSLAMNTQGPSIPMDVYKNIVKVAIKTTGERFPAWWDGAMNQTTATATQVATSLWGKFNNKLDTWAKEAESRRHQEEHNSTEVKARHVPYSKTKDSAPAPLSAKTVRAQSEKKQATSTPASKRAKKATKKKVVK